MIKVPKVFLSSVAEKASLVIKQPSYVISKGLNPESFGVYICSDTKVHKM